MYQRKLIMPAVFQLSYYLLLIIHNKPITLLDLTVQQEFTCQLRLPCFSFPTTANLKPSSCILVFDVNLFSWKRLWHSKSMFKRGATEIAISFFLFMCWKHTVGIRLLTKQGTDSWQNREQILDKTEHGINTGWGLQSTSLTVVEKTPSLQSQREWKDGEVTIMRHTIRRPVLNGGYDRVPVSWISITSQWLY